MSNTFMTPRAVVRIRPAPRATVQLLVRIAPELKKRVSSLALKRGCFETRLVVEALHAFLDAHEKRAGR